MGCNCGSKAKSQEQAAQTQQQRSHTAEIRRLREQQAKEQARQNASK